MREGGADSQILAAFTHRVLELPAAILRKQIPLHMTYDVRRAADSCPLVVRILMFCK